MEHYDQNCVSLCILICSPKILLYFRWSKMGYGARGYSFSVQPFFLRPIRLGNPPTPQTAMKGIIHSLSTFALCLLYIIGRSGQYTLQCSSSHRSARAATETSEIAFMEMKLHSHKKLQPFSRLPVGAKLGLVVVMV